MLTLLSVIFNKVFFILQNGQSIKAGLLDLCILVIDNKIDHDNTIIRKVEMFIKIEKLA